LRPLAAPLKIPLCSIFRFALSVGPGWFGSFIPGDVGAIPSHPIQDPGEPGNHYRGNQGGNHYRARPMETRNRDPGNISRYKKNRAFTRLSFQCLLNSFYFLVCSAKFRLMLRLCLQDLPFYKLRNQSV
jgi:hypothetical protein